MEIRHIARDMEGRDLPIALAILAEAADEAVDDQAGMIHSLPEADEVAVGLDLGRVPGKVQYRLLFRRAQAGAGRETPEKQLKDGLLMQRRGSLVARRERKYLSAIGALGTLTAIRTL